MFFNNPKFLQAASLAGLCLVAISWSQAPEIRAPFIADLVNTIPGMLAGLGVTVVIVERATEVVVNATRSEDKVIQARIDAAIKGNDPANQVKLTERLLEYKAGTERLSLLVGLALGVLLASSGISVLSQVIDIEKAIPRNLSLRRLVDIVLTAGLLAGSSQSFHEIFSNNIRRAVTGGQTLPIPPQQ
jgi:hypothetical protein